MIDIGTVSTAVSSVKTAMEITKLLKDSSNSFNEAEVKLKLSELMDSLADTRIQLAEIKNELLESEDEKKELQKQLDIRKELIFKAPYYWRSEDGPFCQICYDKNNQLILLKKYEDEYHCLSCKQFFGMLETQKKETNIITVSR